MDRILPIPPGPKTTAEDLVRIRQIEAIRLSLRLLDRQLEASAKAAANGSPQHLAFKNACEKFLAELADIRSGERYQKIHAQVAKSMPPPESSIALESDKPDKVVDAEGQIDLVEPNEASVTLTPFDRAQLLVDKEAIEPFCLKSFSKYRKETCLQKRRLVSSRDLTWSRDGTQKSGAA